MKVQIVAEAQTMRIICIFVAKGHEHDFKMFKNSKLKISDLITILADSGYQGIYKLHKNSLIPVKASKNHKLTKKEKTLNRNIARNRIYIEHINRWIKRFKIFGSRYRNKRK